ncbi:hypothetical protein QL093DRAFT_2310272 [Fusarium oxysporum]|nr:hypothetical protein QL093DRAFT_2310272 [Fusarium oxysporum]
MNARLTLTTLVGLQRLYACIPPSCRSSRNISLTPCSIAIFLPDPVIVDVNLNIHLFRPHPKR